MVFNKVKILHCADIHIGRTGVSNRLNLHNRLNPYGEIPGPNKNSFVSAGGNDISRQGRTDKELSAFNKIIELCHDEEIEILLIAGDLFDKIHIDNSIIGTVISSLENLRNVKVFIAPGNHDPYSVDSPYNLFNWPENVYVFRGNLSPVILEDMGVVVWGGGFTTNYTSDLWRISVESEDRTDYSSLNEMINICVLHGDLSSGSVYASDSVSVHTAVSASESTCESVSESTSKPASTISTESAKDKFLYNPIPSEFIENCGFDYVALGHIHKRSEINKLKNTRYAYSGAPVSGGFNERGDLGVYMGEIGKGFNNISFVPVKSVRYMVEALYPEEIKSNRQISDFILTEIRKLHPQNYRDDVFRIILKGEVETDFLMDEKAVENILSGEMNSPQIINQIKKPVNIDEILSEDSLMGIFAGKVLEGTPPEGIDVNRVLRWGLKAFEGEIVFDETDINIY